MKSLKDLFEHQLKDLYSAENQILKAIPKMIENASDPKLKKALEKHRKETEEHKNRLESICSQLGIDPKGETCKAMQGLIREAEGFLKEEATSEVKDAGIIAQVQRVEHYEITGYGTAARYATELGHSKVAKTLQKTLKEEYGADDKLTAMAEKRLNRKAKADKKAKSNGQAKSKKKAKASKKADAKKKDKAKKKKTKAKSKAASSKKAKSKVKAKSKSKAKAKSNSKSTKKVKGSKLVKATTIAKDQAKANKKKAKAKRKAKANA